MASTDLGQEVDEMDLIAEALERECPWHTCSGILDHEGWLDVVGTIKEVYPESYEALRQEEARRRVGR